MNSFEMGKWAALEGLAELYDEGSDLEDLMSEINDILQSDLEKNASEDDSDFRLGIESTCDDFLSKTASYYGSYNVNNEGQAVFDILEKVAWSAEDFLSADDAKKRSSRAKRKDVSDEEVGSWNAKQDKSRSQTQRMNDLKNHPERRSELMDRRSAAADARKASGTLAGRMKGHANSALSHVKQYKGRYAAGAAGVAGLAGAGLLARHLMKKREEEKGK